MCDQVLDFIKFEINSYFQLKKIWRFLLKNQSFIYKGLLLLVSSFLIVYLFPKGGTFKYEFQKGKPWQHPTLYAPFDFSIIKSESELEIEKKTIIDAQSKYYRADLSVVNEVKNSYVIQFNNFFKIPVSNNDYNQLFDYGEYLIDELYKYGILPVSFAHRGNNSVFLIKGNNESTLNFNDFIRLENLKNKLNEYIIKSPFQEYLKIYYELLFEVVQPNISLDEKFTKNIIDQAIKKISVFRGLVQQNMKIISKGEMVEGEKHLSLLSLKNEYSSRLWNQYSYYWIIFGYSILVLLTFLSLMLFINNYRPEIFDNNLEMTFIFLNVVIIIALTTIIVNFDVKLLYAVPICILPLILKTFFDPRLGLFTHVITILNLGFIVPNSFEFVFLQIMAGIVTILSITQLQNRANLFITVGRIVMIYLLCYISFTIIHEGGISNINFVVIGLFLLNGLLTLFAQPLIYLCERIFKLVSDVSLLELSDTNSKLLKDLSNKAPGSFHHSLQVANLAETAAAKIGANTLLARVGALYHDIGKINTPAYFSENQTGGVSPHEGLSPEQSAKIIINHVKEGIEIAKKHKLPDRIIDFIRTHHGNSWVYYFYKKAQETDQKIYDKDFQYPGPKPFSKETAILMMSDSVEAASKSLREPTVDKIEQFVNSIIDKQIDEKQFNNCNITLSEIETVKKVLSKKLINVYHLRVEYPE